MKIIITENQLKYINEALGVPDNILEAAEEVFDIFEKKIKSITRKEDKYEFDGELDIVLGNKKKIKIDSYELIVSVTEYEEIKGDPIIVSMGMAQSFTFDRDVMMKRIQPSTTAEFEIDYAVSAEGWEPHELYDSLMKDKVVHLSSLAHEIKHKYDKQAKELDLVGREAEYTATQRRSNFGIPIIDHYFFRFMYFVSATENLVRQTELASEMRSKNITKSQFRDFLENQKVYKELVEIKNFTFDKLLQGLYDSMDRVDALLLHVDEDPSEMTDEEKINRVLELVYINIVNMKVGVFMEMIRNKEDAVKDFLRQLTGGLPKFLSQDDDAEKMDNLKRKFTNYAAKYQDDPIRFFKDECENFSYNANKVLKRIGKLYALAKDDKPVSESILNWELYQKVREQKYGTPKIHTKYNFPR